MRPFLVENGRTVSYAEFKADVSSIASGLDRHVRGKRAFALEAENTLPVYTKFLALTECGHAVLPCPSYQFHDAAYRSFLREESRTDFIFCEKSGTLEDAARGAPEGSALHPLIADEMKRGALPLILRTSGSSGKKYKYVLHDYARFRAKFSRIPHHFERTLAFSPFESVAGIETLTETFFHQRTLVAAGDRLSLSSVAALLRENSIDYFQTTPSFLNLMLISRLLRPESVGALRKIAYGSEPSSRVALEEILKQLPGVELMHTYGMTEIGILRTRTNPSDPSAFALSEELNPGRLRDGLLEVKSMSPMVAYLNEMSEKGEDGWFSTQDKAEVLDDGYLRVLGRADDTINVAGRKFFPSELECLILAMGGVGDALVCREKNDLIGEAIVARVVLSSKQETEPEFRARFREYCEARIPFFMRPHRLLISDENLVNSRFKKVRGR